MKTLFVIGNGESRKCFDLEKLRPHGKIYGCNAVYRDFTPDVLVAVDQGISHEIYQSGYAYDNECWFRNWVKHNEKHYDRLLYQKLSDEKITELKKHFTNHIENEKGNSTEFVMHGHSYSSRYGTYESCIEKKESDSAISKKLNHSGLYVSWIKEDKANCVDDIQVKDKGWSTGPTAAWIAIEQCKPKEVYMIGFDFDSNTGNINNLYKGTNNYYAVQTTKTPDVNWRNQWDKIISANPDIVFTKVNESDDMSLRTNVPLYNFKKFNNVRYTTYEKCFFNR